MATLKFIFILFEVLLLFNLLIAVHELGHFLAAKWRGLKIDRFAVWFGKPIWKKKINGIEYALGWIPAGGYVALPQMATMEAIEGKGESSGQPLPPITPLDKIIVAFAGPLFSFLLAVIFAVIVWQVGKPISIGDDEPVLGWVQPDGPAWKAGLRAGDKVLAIDGHPIKHFGPPSQDSIIWRVITSEGTNIAITYSRDGKEDTVHAVPFKRDTKWYERKALRQILVDFQSKAIVDSVMSNSPAAVAGLTHGDEITRINGEKVFSYRAVEHARDLMTNQDAPPFTFTIKRGTEEFDRQMRAEKPMSPTNAPAMFGIAWLVDTNRTLEHPSPWEQIKTSANQIVATIGAVISKKSDIGPQQLGGAVMIIRVYSNLFDNHDGWRLVLWFSVVLNVNLAMLNMLPLPVLDGGHIVLSFVEAIRRRPVSARFLNYVQSGFAVLLIAFMLWIAFYDTGDWIRTGRESRDQPIIFAPKDQQ
jgi:regulator of sigma E protease